MNNFLLKIGMGIIAFVFILSCYQEAQELSILKDTVEIIANPHAISKEDIIAKALEFTKRKIESEETIVGRLVIRKSTGLQPEQESNRQAYVTSKNYSVRIEQASSKDKEIRQEIPVYTINYKDEKEKESGFVVMAGDERISNNVLIFSKKSNASFNMDVRDDAEFLEDMIAGYLYKSINIEEFNNPVNTRGTLTIVNNGFGEILYSLDYKINFAQSGDPYNKYTPFRSGSRSLAGCTAVAMSEIMAWHDWPLQGIFPRYTTNTSSPVNVTVSYSLTSSERAGILGNNMVYILAFYPNAAEYVANLLVETGYRLNSNYGLSVTTAYPSDVPSVFSEMGYTTGSYSSFSISAIDTDVITRVLPVFMAGWKSGGGGHAYVIYGVIHYTVGGNVQKYIQIIDGNNNEGYSVDPVTGGLQTWFNAAMFSTNYTDPGYVLPAYEFFYPYRFNCMIITNIKPNWSKNGSTNPNWTVGSTNPY